MLTLSIKGRIHYKDSCKTCQKDKGYVRKYDLGKDCRSCSNSKSKLGKPSSKKGIKTNKPAWNRGKYFNNPLQKQVRDNMSRRLRHCINKQNVHIFDLVGYSVEELIINLESKFEPNMTWDNYGRKPGIKCWEIDHIIPESLFNYSSFSDDDFK